MIETELFGYCISPKKISLIYLVALNGKHVSQRRVSLDVFLTLQRSASNSAYFFSRSVSVSDLRIRLRLGRIEKCAEVWNWRIDTVGSS